MKIEDIWNWPIDYFVRKLLYTLNVEYINHVELCDCSAVAANSEYSLSSNPHAYLVFKLH